MLRTNLSRCLNLVILATLSLTTCGAVYAQRKVINITDEEYEALKQSTQGIDDLLRKSAIGQSDLDRPKEPLRRMDAQFDALRNRFSRTTSPIKTREPQRDAKAPSRGFDFSRFDFEGLDSSLKFPKSASPLPDQSQKEKPLDLRSFRDQAQRAYETANRENKCLLLFFSSGDSRGCVAVRESLRDKCLARFSHEWIVADTDPNRDAAGKAFADLYGVGTFPSLILIKTSVNRDAGGVTKVDVVGRMRGEQSASQIRDFFGRALRVYRNKHRVLDMVAYHDRVFEAWETAKREEKYVLWINNAQYSGFSKRTLDNMTDPRLAKYADRLIVVDTDPDIDTDAELFIKRFDVKKYPTILLLRPVVDPTTKQVKQVDLVGRMSGEQTAEEMDNYFQMALDRYLREREHRAVD